MKKLSFRMRFLVSLILIVSLSVCFGSNTAYCQEADIVQMESMYTYGEMVEDINQLVATYPTIVSTKSIGTTALGRSIPLVILGNQKASHNILIQATIHGREYLGTQVSMNMIEYYAQNSATFKAMLDNCCLYIVPMANPDGVCIAQSGAASTSNVDTQNFIKAIGNTKSWKANAMGVDLNRNFDIGWANLTPRVSGPSFKDFKGVSAVSENESKALVALANERPYDAFISYHMQGNIIYYDEPGNTDENSVRSTTLAQTISNFTGYKLSNLKDAVANNTVQQGGFNDWVQIQFNKPGVTVELGSSLPPNGQKYVNSIYNKNKDTWNAVTDLYY